jgi:hypothetical protein
MKVDAAVALEAGKPLSVAAEQQSVGAPHAWRKLLLETTRRDYGSLVGERLASVGDRRCSALPVKMRIPRTRRFAARAAPRSSQR